MYIEIATTYIELTVSISCHPFRRTQRRITRTQMTLLGVFLASRFT